MQKWWVGAVALAAVVLAVLLIGSPDTGGDVTEREVDVPVISEGPASSDELIRGAAEPADIDRSAAAVPIGADGLPLSKGNPLAANPIAKGVILRRTAPEAQWAARTMAPWTQIRRELAKTGDPRAEEVIPKIQALVTDIRALRRDPATRDFDAIVAQQDEVEAAVKATGLVNEEITSMFSLIDQRMASYSAGEYEPPAEEGQP
ncbi:MAG: hypothetical protein KC912_00950 [Proteobacteria bacterium]|nr:hypothetical protein [Pseudomonadota bacterium]